MQGVAVLPWSSESCELLLFGAFWSKITVFRECKSSPGRTDVVTYHIYGGNLRAEREFKQQIVNSINPNNEKYITCIRGPRGVDWSEGAAGGRKEQLKSWGRKRRQRRALLSSQVIPLNPEGWKYVLLININCCPEDLSVTHALSTFFNHAMSREQGYRTLSSSLINCPKLC